MEFDESVDHFGAAVAGAGGVEVGQERDPPAAQRSSEPAISAIGTGKLPMILIASSGRTPSRIVTGAE